MRQEFLAVPFLDGVHAKGNLARLERRLAPSLIVPLASLLAQSPDPDGALRLLERYAEAAPPEVLQELALHPAALTYLVAMFGYNESLGETALTDPSLVLYFARDRHFTKLKSIEDLMQDYARFSVTSPDLWLSSQLARFKRRNLLRIVLKDVLGLSTLGESTLEISTLADVILKHALSYCDQELEKRYGRPQFRDQQGRIARCGFSIVSLGNLGGNELNYGSDIDLLFFYARDGETAGGSEPSSVISNKEYFVRLAEAIHRTISQPTPHGEIYRVDLRVRPEGKQGDFAISVSSAMEYYDHRARDWELQMLIKARHSAGDLRVTREFLHGVEPYVFRPPTNAGGVERDLDGRERTTKVRHESRETALDVKLHPGGIRDIEFLVQRLQRMYGEGDSWVRSGGTLLALRKLNDKGLLLDVDFARLTSAYEFFRKVEHRIQLITEIHAHRLPVGRHDLDRLARRVGIESGTSGDAGTALVSRLKYYFDHVNEIYERLMHSHPVSTPEDGFQLRTTSAWTPEHDLYQSTLRLLDSRAPDLACVVREVPLGDRAQKHAARLLSALLGSSEHFREARQFPERLRRALKITVASPYLAQVMIQHPEDLAALDLLHCEEGAHSFAQMEIGLKGPMPEEIGHPRDAQELTTQPTEGVLPFPWTAEGGLSFSEGMALLRTEYRMRGLALCARDCAKLDSIFISLNQWTNLATTCVSSALAIAADSKVQDRGRESLPFAVLGLGRLGRNEFDLATTVDLVFVGKPGFDAEEITSMSRWADRTIEALSSYTRDGSVFAIDTRLQPQGAPGGGWMAAEDDFLKFVGEAATFDQVISYTNVCLIAGNMQVGSQFLSRLAPILFDRFASWENFEDELRESFQRFNPENVPATHDIHGASAGDGELELSLAVLRLRHRLALPPATNVLEQIAALSSAALISDPDAQTLSRDASFLRTVDHALRLVTGTAPERWPENAPQIDAVESLTRHWGLIGPDDSLAAQFNDTMQQVRSMCRRLAGIA